MQVTEATNQQTWDTFLSSQPYRPFLQSWTMGEVYRDIGQEPIRLQVEENGEVIGICQGIVVPARRGRHIAVSYGPLCSNTKCIPLLQKELERIAKAYQCTFVRMSPFVPMEQALLLTGKPSPLHLLAEHIWYIPLCEQDYWKSHQAASTEKIMRTTDTLMADMRKNHRNLIRRATKEGVVVQKSQQPMQDLPLFLQLHEETRKRHGFTPYTDAFFTAQLQRFSQRNECTLYIARYKNEVIATSMHMHAFGETSYHHGASTTKYPKIPASYLLQWTAIQDAIARKDHVYSFWGIAPAGSKKHPFAGVTTFKTGFGGSMLELQHCTDIPVQPRYYLTRGFEYVRKWRRGF